MKKVFASIIAIGMIVSLIGCGSQKESASDKSGEEVTINIAYQYGLAYAPVVICQHNNMIEKSYEESTGKKVNVTWTQMSSGADINTGIASGDIQFGFMGIAPAITGVSKNVGYKIFTGISGQENGMMTNDKTIKALSDLVGSDSQIALVNIGSMPHIILGKALEDNGFDAHALDANIVGMKYPDGMAALQSGSLACNLTSNPYIYLERESGDFAEIPEIANSWDSSNSFIVGVASTDIAADSDLYNAVCDAISKSIDFVNENKEETAKVTSEYDSNSVEDEIKYLNYGTYSAETIGIFELAQFMYKNSFIDKEIKDYSELVFDNVKGN